MTKQQQLRNTSAERSIPRAISLIGAASALAIVATAALADDPNAGGVSNNRGRPLTEQSRASPLANTSASNARLIVPDGTSLGQSVGVGEIRWFAFGAEAGKTYSIEAADPYADRDLNGVSIAVFDSDGVSAPPETNSDCAMDQVAPALNSFNAAVDGARCIVRVFVPAGSTALNKRGIYIAVTLNHIGSFQVRVRESTIYGRWTTNGYDFHVELQNTTTESICAQVVRYPGGGELLPTGTVSITNLTVPPMGANKVKYSNGSTVAGDNKGALRIHACTNPVNLVPGSLQVNTYAYNPVTQLFIPYSNSSTNNGGQNSW